MRTTQTNKLKMFDAVLTECDAHPSIWESHAAFSSAINTFRAKNEALKGLINVQINSSKGITADKELQLKAVVDKALILSNVLGAYAQSVKATELLYRNLYTKSEWLRGNSLLRVEHLKRLKDDVVENLTDLVPYGVTQADIDAFDQLITSYEHLVKMPRAAIVNHKDTTKYLGELITEMDSFLTGQLDRIVHVFQPSEPRFVKRYFDARIIVDAKGKRMKGNSPLDPPAEPSGGDEFSGIF